MQNLDLSFFTAINNLAGHNKLLDVLMIGLAKWGIVIYGGILLYLFFASQEDHNSRQNQQAVFRATIAGFLALGVNLVIGSVFFRPRPFVGHHVHLLIDHPADSSFPSDHAAGASGISFSLIKQKYFLGKLLTCFTILMLFARVYVGVHYPLDVMGGMAIGYLGCLIENIIWPWYATLVDYFIDLLQGIWDKIGATPKHN